MIRSCLLAVLAVGATVYVVGLSPYGWLCFALGLAVGWPLATFNERRQFSLTARIFDRPAKQKRRVQRRQAKMEKRRRKRLAAKAKGG